MNSQQAFNVTINHAAAEVESAERNVATQLRQLTSDLAPADHPVSEEGRARSARDYAAAVDVLVAARERLADIQRALRLFQALQSQND